MEQIKEKFGSAITKTEVDNVGCPIVWVQKASVIEVLKFVKQTAGLEFIFLSDLTAYDDQGSQDEGMGRFVVVYNLFSPQNRNRLRIKTRTHEGEKIPTACGVWDAANWAEREVYDMFGVQFEGHPDMRRILMDVRWEGYPLRKDYPLRRYQLFNDPEPVPMHLLEPKAGEA